MVNNKPINLQLSYLLNMNEVQQSENSLTSHVIHLDKKIASKRFPSNHHFERQIFD